MVLSNSGPAFLSDNQRLELTSHPRTLKTPPLTTVSSAFHCTRAALESVTLSCKCFTFHKSIPWFLLSTCTSLVCYLGMTHLADPHLICTSHLVRRLCLSRCKIKLNSTQDIELCLWDKDKISWGTCVPIYKSIEKCEV